MTREQFLERFPKASEACIRANCTPAPWPLENGLAWGVRSVSRPSDPLGKAKTQPKPKRASNGKQRVERTRNMGTWTESQYYQRIRSCLRRMSMFWKPALAALKAARVPFAGPRGQKWAFLCADCGKLFKRKLVQIDHDCPCGALTSHEHIGAFVARLLPEDPKAFRVRCKACHQIKTNKEREEAQ